MHNWACQLRLVLDERFNPANDFIELTGAKVVWGLHLDFDALVDCLVIKGNGIFSFRVVEDGCIFNFVVRYCDPSGERDHVD